ncbi:vWA domain-containing protein [Actinomycetospora soli]|uniref:vWA domain-containing protein n=1 Tax=Actinomycetospora soli TaxID=2893887 RepID=UPI001E4AF21B|nr:VWA domain-containing protein [Actinomycetospora soli]MCD2191484.1 VWA domain-containing protein [Actinomycetospora soli]
MNTVEEAVELTSRTCVDLAAELRRHDVPVGPEQTTALWTALHRLDGLRLRDLYWAGRVVLVGDRRHFAAFDAAFRRSVLGETDDGDTVEVPHPVAVPMVDREEQAASTPGPQPADPLEDEADEARLTPSDVRVLKHKSFAAMTAVDQRRAAALIRRLEVDLPRRRSRRRVPAARGRHLDTRGVLRAALRTDGEPIRLARRRHPWRDRPITLVVDVSGSMAPYALAVLRFAHALRRAGHDVEVFTIGIELTRITEELARPAVDAALTRISAAVHDWDGGTRLGSSMGTLVERFGGHRAVRGAVVVICSDGLDRDEPELLGDAVREVHRAAHRVLWLNPLKGDPRFEPIQRGMAAALPFVDLLLAGHDLAALEELCAALAVARRPLRTTTTSGRTA